MVFRSVPLFLCLILLCFSCNNKNTITDNLKDNEELVSFSDTLREANLIDWIRTLKKESQEYRGLNKPDSALIPLDKCINELWRKPQSEDEIKALGWVYANRGYIHEQLLGNYLQAKKDYLNALEQFDKCDFEDFNVAAYVLHPLGNIHTRFGENEQAVVLLKRCRRNAIESGQTAFTLNAYNDLGRVYMNKNDYPLALKTFQEGLTLSNHQAFYDGLFYSGMAESYDLSGLIDSGIVAGIKSVEFLKKAVKIIPETDYQFILAKKYLIGSQMILGTLFARKKAFDKSELYLHQALNKAKTIFGRKHRKIAKILLCLGDSYTESGQLANGVNAYQKSLVSVLPKFESENFRETPSLDVLVPDVSVGEGLIGKARTLFKLYYAEKEIAFLHLSLKTYQAYFEWENILRAEQQSFHSKLLFASEIHQIGEEVLAVLYQIQKIDPSIEYTKLAFSIIDQTKGILLSESNQQLLNEISFPKFDSSVQMLNDQKTQLSILSVKLNDLNLERDSILEDKLINEIERLDYNYQLTLHGIRKHYPNYGLTIYRDNSLQISDSLSLISCNNNTDFLNFFVGDSSLYLSCIHNGKFSFYKLNFLNYKKKVGLFMDELHNENAKTAAFYNQKSFSLYDVLFKDVKTKLLADNWFIFPDRELNKIPFEALTTSDGSSSNFKSLNYLLFERNVAYAPSSQFILNLPKSNSEMKEFLGVAPIFKNDSKYSYLQGAKEEVLAAKGNFKGETLFGNKASKVAFLAKVEDFKIVHICSHAGSDKNKLNNGWITFHEDEKENLLISPELFQLNLSTELLVLNACETGEGQFKDGEGPLSLTRGFLDAGVQNVVTNLWQANHTTNSDIFKSFYTELANSASPAEALSSAKKKYLKSAKTDALSAHPRYWAAPILIGNGSSLTIVATNRNLRNLLVIVSLLIASISVFLFLRRK